MQNGTLINLVLFIFNGKILHRPLKDLKNCFELIFQAQKEIILF